MYITFNDIIGSKTIDLPYPIQGKEALGPHTAEIAVVSMLSNNAQIWLQRTIEVLIETGEKVVLSKGVYTDKELDSLIGTGMKLQMLDSHEDILRANKLEKVKKMTISLNELDNSDNLEDGQPSNTLVTYYVTEPEYSMCFEPRTPYYNKLKSDMINSLSLKIMDQAGNIITDGPGMTVVLHIKNNSL